MDEPQILIPAEVTAFSSEFFTIVQHLLPATIQAKGLGGGEAIVINSLGIFSTALLTLSANFADQDSVTIGPRTYLLEDALDNALDGSVLIEVAATDTLDNLINAINVGPGQGTKYSNATTVNNEVSAIVGVSPVEMRIDAKIAEKAGQFVVSTASATASWDGGVMVFEGAPIFEGGSAVELTETNNTIAINSPVIIQAVKEATGGQVLVTLAYGNKV